MKETATIRDYARPIGLAAACCGIAIAAVSAVGLVSTSIILCMSDCEIVHSFLDGHYFFPESNWLRSSPPEAGKSSLLMAVLPLLVLAILGVKRRVRRRKSA